MTYVLDTDIFIRAKNDHYRFAFAPAFWDWLVVANKRGRVHSIDAVLQEITQAGKLDDGKGLDELAEWSRGPGRALFEPLAPSANAKFLQIVEWVNSRPQYRLGARNRFLGSADPLLVAQASALHWTLVTHEISAPNSKRTVKIPDVCGAVDPPVECVSPFEMLELEGAKFVLRSISS